MSLTSQLFFDVLALTVKEFTENAVPFIEPGTDDDS
jgi:hypothetical protein